MSLSTGNPTVQVGSHSFTWNWKWQNQSYLVVYETRGEGQPLLLLPALSTVSSRLEVQSLADSLAAEFQTITLDWLGFGHSNRPALDYTPALYQQLLEDFVTSTFDQPVGVIAAGHAAGYVLQIAQRQPQIWSKIVLVVPTWRGPLPTMGVPAPIASGLRHLVRSPLLGQALYKLNTLPAFLRFMYRRHVFTNPEHLTPEFIHQKWQITQQPGARFAPAAFVTGKLDPVQQRTDFLKLFQGVSTSLMVVIGEHAPPKSKAEMESLANLPEVQIQRMAGTLGLHEEYADELTALVLPFLRQ